jgi:hypothetical protein
MAINSDPKDINRTDMVMATFLPDRSAIRPKSHPPIGLIKNPTAKMAAVFKSCAVEFPFGKNTGAKYKANAE